MSKILQKYGNFSTAELDRYANKAGSCVTKVNSKMHLAMGPYSLADFKHTLHAHLIQKKVGVFDCGLGGIVLGIKNIKVLGTTAALRGDDPTIHINIQADFYIFCPKTGVVLKGIVKHISHRQVSVIIYRVFNAAIRYSNKLKKDEVVMNQEIKFRIKSFDLQNAFPYIEGEILLQDAENMAESKKFKKFDISFQDKGGKDHLDKIVAFIKEEKNGDQYFESMQESQIKMEINPRIKREYEKTKLSGRDEK